MQLLFFPVRMAQHIVQFIVNSVLVSIVNAIMNTNVSITK